MPLQLTSSSRAIDCGRLGRDELTIEDLAEEFRRTDQIRKMMVQGPAARDIDARHLMKVEIWSDVVCPWCYIGKRRIEAALEQFQQRDEIEVTYRAFELDPRADPDPGMSLEARLSVKYGVPIEQARAMNARVTAVAAEDGLEYRLDRARPGNTFDAHRLIHLARAEGLQGEMKERLMAAYFVEGRPIGNRDTLLELAAEVGIDPRRARAVFNGDEFAPEVRADELEAAQLGISGVPYFVIDRRYGVSGAQPAQLLVRALDHAWAEARAAV